MKKMTCRQLGGACEEEFHANTFDEIAAKSRDHGMEMVKKGDNAHIEAMKEMQNLMQSPQAMYEWMENRRKEFDVLPSSNS